MRRLDERRRSFTLLDWLAFFVPFAGWIRTYERSWLQSDVLAGLSVACMEIPQVRGHVEAACWCPMCSVSTCGGLPLQGLWKIGPTAPLRLAPQSPAHNCPPTCKQAMSYASLAGLPLSFGLYGALAPCLVFMLFSTSRQLVRLQLGRHTGLPDDLRWRYGRMAPSNAAPFKLRTFRCASHLQAVGPVSITSMLLGSGLRRIFDGRINADPNHPDDPQLQAEYNQAAIQVGQG